MNDIYIPIKKLADVHNNDFYPLSAAKGTITTEDIDVKNVLGGTYGDRVPASSNLYDILSQILGTEFKTGMDLDVEELSDSKIKAPSSYLLTKLLLAILGGNLNLKFKVCTYQEYQQWLSEGIIDNNTLYFTTGGSPSPSGDYWIITFNANGGTVDETTRSVSKGNAYGSLPRATYTGYDFIGWYTQISGGNIVGSSDIPDSNITLYAHWIESSSTEEDLLCLEEDSSTLIITEDKKYNINISSVTTEPILATEVNHDPIITEDKKNNISLKTSSESLLATEINHDPVVTEDKKNNISLKTSTESLLATEAIKDLVKTEDAENNISLKTTSTNSSVSISIPEAESTAINKVVETNDQPILMTASLMSNDINENITKVTKTVSDTEKTKSVISQVAQVVTKKRRGRKRKSSK